MKSVKALRVFVIMLLAAMITLFVCMFWAGVFASPTEHHAAVGALVLFALLIILPMAGFVVCGVALIVSLFLLFSAKMQKGGAVTALAATCALLPAWILAMIAYALIALFSVTLTTILVVATVVYVAAFVTACVATHQLRSRPNP